MADKETALIVGSGRGLSASLARLFAAEGMRVVLAARNVDKLAPLTAEIGGKAYPCDASDPKAVTKLFASTTSEVGAPDIVVYNASNRGGRGPVEELDAEAVRQAILITCYGGFLVGQAAARQMIRAAAAASSSPARRRATRATPSPPPSPWASSGCAAWRKAWRASCRRRTSMWRISRSTAASARARTTRARRRGEDDLLDPDAIAQTYLHVHRQHRSAWSWEIELRPWSETF